MQEVKPCPFCGLIPVVEKFGLTSYWQVVHSCAVIEKVAIRWKPNKEDAVRWWNKRLCKK